MGKGVWCVAMQLGCGVWGRGQSCNAGVPTRYTHMVRRCPSGWLDSGRRAGSWLVVTSTRTVYCRETHSFTPALAPTHRSTGAR